MLCQARPLPAHRRPLAAALVGAVLLLAAAGASALSFPGDVYLLPTTDSPPDVVLDDQTWIRLHPISPTDPGPTDYDASLTAGQARVVSGLTVVPLTFDITWNGTRDEGTPFSPVDDRLLFTIIDSRQGTGRSLLTTVDVPNSGLERGSFGGDLLSGEIIVQDAPFGGFVHDGFGLDRWVGVYLDAVTTPQTVTVNWVLSGSLPLNPSTNDVWIANAMFARVGEVPEPTAALLLTGGLLGLALRSRSGG